MTLRPEKDITKILLSTPSYFVGNYEDNGFLLTRAWTKEDALSYASLNMSYFILAIKTPPPDTHPGAIISDYSRIGDIVCVYLSMLYGKRFDNHGLVESVGHFYRPSPSPISIYDPRLPFNSRNPRPDLEIPLSLREIKRIAPLVKALLNEEQCDEEFEEFMHFLISAGRFYVHALQQAESQPEIAFLDLITCGEILSNFPDYDPDELLDTQIKADLARIEKEIKGGEKLVKRIQGRLFSIKRKFIKTIHNLLNPYFFQQSEARESYDRLNQADISARIKAAYDLRSRYVHTGVDFGEWIKPIGRFNNEIQMGTPVIEDGDLKKILTRSPTFIGMERIMRFCLLRFMHLNGVFIDLRLEGKGLGMSEEEATKR